MEILKIDSASDFKIINMSMKDADDRKVVFWEVNDWDLSQKDE